MKRVIKLLSTASAGVLMMGALAGCGGSSDSGSAKDIKIGANLEMSGGSASFGISPRMALT